MTGLKNVVHLYNGISPDHKEPNTAICNNMDGPGGPYVQWTKSNRERQVPYGVTYTWNLETNTNELI